MTTSATGRSRSRAFTLPLILLGWVVLLGSGASAIDQGSAAPPSVTELLGAWMAHASHSGETSDLVLELVSNSEGKLSAKYSNPALHIWGVPIGPVAVEPSGVRVQALGMTLSYDRAAQTLTGTLPPALVPVYSIEVKFQRIARLERKPRLEPSAPIATPVWTYDAGAPLWADAAFAHGAVLVGADDGRLHACDARSGKSLWIFRTGGAIRGRPTVAGEDLFVQTDDGFLYKVNAKTGEERWHIRVEEKPIERLPIADPKSRYDYRASAATMQDGRLYVGTYGGHVLALDPNRGARLWDFAAGDLVLSTPLVSSGKVYFGSFDGNEYALDAATGALLWKHDTGGAVSSAAAIYDGRVIVGSRSYDLLALDSETGKAAWTRYYWFSWVESPATVFGDSIYIGSSDAAKLFAFDGRTGRRLWEIDAGGAALGQPAVSDARVFIGALGSVHYMVPHSASVLAVDRKSGKIVWRYPVAAPPETSSAITDYGFAGSPALGEGLVFVPSLDGHLYAFAQ
jgi:outer membrane protein assembly factor BamB